ncbi:MAG: hypothetical protein JW855_02450 [Gammaproteobacteria bacterium]|nr:hypothetical protein [Gammaproteobacteria bacterium]
MKFSVAYLPAESDLVAGDFIITCEDDEAKYFMEAINRELKWMEAKRVDAVRKGSKMGVREIPHYPMQKEDDHYHFNSMHKEDVCLAARHLVGEEQEIIITTEMVDELEKELYEKGR